MKNDVMDTHGITKFLYSNGLHDIVSSRLDGIAEYNQVSYKKMSYYVKMLCQIINTSPLIENKHELLFLLLQKSHY